MLSHWPYSLLLFPALHLAWEDFRMRGGFRSLAGRAGGVVRGGWLGRVRAVSDAVACGGECRGAGCAGLCDAAVPVVSPQVTPGLFSQDFGAGDAVMMAAVARCSHLASTCVSCSRPASQHWCGGASGARRPFPWPDLWR